MVKDGRGGEPATTYSYAGGKYNFVERRFLGMGQETEFLPCIAGESTCPTVARTFSQDFASVGAVKDETYRNGAALIVGQTSRIFTANNATPPYTSLPTEEIAYRYEAPGSGLSPGYLALRKVFTYDARGNITLEQDHGRNDVTGDERSIYTDFAPNNTAYIVSLPARSSTHAALTSAGALLERTLFLYDNASAYSTAPVKGDLTKRQVQIDAGGTLASETFEYDTYGNRTAAIDPVNNRSEWTFDTTYNLYPVSEKNALLQTKNATLFFPCGLPATATDLNCIVTTYTYDVFCRETLASRTATGAYTATDYLNFGTPATQSVRTRRPHPGGGGGEVYEAQHFDGLGRVWRAEKSGPAVGTPIRVDTAFDNRGNRASETHPYYAGATAYTTSYRYDALDRLILTTLPDAETRSVLYDIDRRTAAPASSGQVPVGRIVTTDELGRQSVVVSNAQEQPVELTRFLGATPVVESRRYDLAGRLLGLTDPGGSLWSYTYDLRGLRLTASDPDLGAWSYVHDLAGRLSTQTDARSLQTVLTYDALSRVLTRTSTRPDAQVEVTTNTYDQVRATYFNIGHLTSSAKTLAGANVASQAFDRDGEWNLAREQ
jgi:YD repeat-containing protein